MKMQHTLNPTFHAWLSLFDQTGVTKSLGCTMYLKKVDGPRQVTLPDGSVLNRADLPPVETRRWVASRKAVVVKAVIHGLITESEALSRYSLSEEEFASWRSAVDAHGEKALKVTTIQKYRQL
jgi:hypothetical protein